MKRIKPNDLKKAILAQSGLVQVQPVIGQHKKIRMMVYPKAGLNKTPLMKYLERKYSVSISDVLMSGSLSVVARSLGNEVDITTISKWIKRFKLRYTKDNLPVCMNCNYHQPACDSGVCTILVNLELWNLVLLKKDEVLACLKY